MKCAAGMGTAVDELGIAKAATQALISGCGFPRAAVLRGTGGSKTNIDQVEVLSVRDSRQREGEPQNFSRTLLAACAEGQTVVMTSADVPRYGQSIVSLGIGSAICAPVLIDGVPDSYLYVDARATDRSPPISGDSPEVVSFCQAVAHIHSLALANLYRGRLEQDKRRRHAELQSARDVQAIIMPPSSGTHGQLEYAMRSIPGRYVAGDLFDIIPINEHRVAMLLGDVVGKGIAAGMMMANVQAHLYQLLRHGDDPATAATSINAIVNGYSQRFSSERDGASLFLSLFIAVIDAQQRSVRWVDCGHGYWLVRGAGGHARQISGEPGLPVGVVPETQYESCEFALQAGDRLIIYSDGVAEQRSPQGDMFGTDRIATVLVKSTGVHTDAPMLVDAVLAHAAMNVAPGESPFADDVTVASVGLIA
jgi:serine phosphatase RsbU (regulator of sigma subunit)